MESSSYSSKVFKTPPRKGIGHLFQETVLKKEKESLPPRLIGSLRGVQGPPWWHSATRRRFVKVVNLDGGKNPLSREGVMEGTVHGVNPRYEGEGLALREEERGTSDGRNYLAQTLETPLQQPSKTVSRTLTKRPPI